MADVSAHVQGEFLDVATELLSHDDYQSAMELAEGALADPATRLDAASVLAAVAYRSGQLATAIRLLESVHDENARTSDVPELLAVLNCVAGRGGTALYYAKLTTICPPLGRARPLFGDGFPSLSDAFLNPPNKPLLASARSLLAQDAADDAITGFEQHLELFPNDVEGLDGYADALAAAGRTREAVGVLRSVLTLGGPSATLYCRMGDCLTELGEHEQARACHAEALARAPKALPLLTNILLDLDRHGDAAHALRQSTLSAYAQAIAATAPKTVRKAPAADGGKPRLCIGYLCRAVSGETRAMVAQLALAHDRNSVSVVGFGEGDLALPANAALRGAFDRWVDVAPLDELTLSVIVRGEAVDVLIDADGMMTATRPHLFARNAAPLQLGWLNLPDGFVPAGAHGSLIGAPCPALLLPRADAPATVRAPGPVAFAADATMAQLTPEVARVWSAILHAVPNATMALYDRALSVPDNTARVIDLFGNFGVAHRIDVIAGQSVDEMLTDCDVALAPFPAPPATSYGKALSLGIPVIALDAGPGRLLAQTIRHSGFAGDRMVAAQAGDYLARACDWASDEAARVQARADAAAIAATSAAFDARAFAAGIESFARDQLTNRAAV